MICSAGSVRILGSAGRVLPLVVMVVEGRLHEMSWAMVLAVFEAVSVGAEAGCVILDLDMFVQRKSLYLIHDDDVSF
jgi:hypothetical protein